MAAGSRRKIVKYANRVVYVNNFKMAPDGGADNDISSVNINFYNVTVSPSRLDLR